MEAGLKQANWWKEEAHLSEQWEGGPLVYEVGWG